MCLFDFPSFCPWHLGEIAIVLLFLPTWRRFATSTTHVRYLERGVSADRPRLSCPRALLFIFVRNCAVVVCTSARAGEPASLAAKASADMKKPAPGQAHSSSFQLWE